MSGLRRRTQRAQSDPATVASETTDRAYRCALQIASLIGPLAARYGLLIAIEKVRGGAVTVSTVDRVTCAARCWGCGDALGGETGKVSWLNAEALVGAAAPAVMVRSCAGCAAVAAPEGATA